MTDPQETAPRYVVRKSSDTAYSHQVFDLQEGRVMAFGSEETCKDWAEQLNEKGYVQAR